MLPITKKHIAITFGFAIAVFGASMFVFLTGGHILRYSDTTGIKAVAFVQGATTSPAAVLPTRLVIPAMQLDTVVESVGLTPQGEMGVPKGSVDVAWFDLGPRPGQRGSAVIAGHYGWKDGIAAAFDHLSALRVGNELYVVDEKGATTTFIVRDIRDYDQYADASGIFSSTDGKAHLNLITCEGVWSGALKSYAKRLVVFTDRM